MDTARLRAEAQRILQKVGPLEPGELASQLEASQVADVPSPRQLFSLLLDEVPGQFAAFPLADARLVDLDHLLDGLQLTHVVSQDERAGGHLVLEPDLGPLVLMCPDGRHVPLVGDGADAGFDFERLTGPPGWLPATPAVIVRIQDGAVELLGLDQVPAVQDTTVERLRRGFVAADEDRSADAPGVLVETLARTPRLFRQPQAPLGELFEAAGIRAVDDRLVDADDANVEAAVSDLADHLMIDHGLGPTSADAVATLNDMVADLLDLVAQHADELFDRGGPPPLDGVVDLDVLPEVWDQVLADEQATLAVAHDVVGTALLAAVGVLTLLDRGADRVRGRRAKANRHWLRARLLEFIDDDDLGAERELRRARGHDERHPEVNFDLARYVADRGQAGAAIALLRQVDGAGVADCIHLLARFAQPGPADAGRNDPCPCGSGRKYKVCCAATNGWPLADRIDWVWDKVVRFSVSPATAWVIESISRAADAPVAGPEGIEDITIANLVLFEGGVLTELCDRRGPLLPADELELLREWADTRARAFETVGVSAGRGLELLDLTSGERIEVRDRSLSRSLEVGAAVLAWIIEYPDGPAAARGIVVVPDHQRGALLSLLDRQPDAEELAVWYATLHAAPKLRNTDGEPLVITTLTYQLDDPETARNALAAHLEVDGDDYIAVADDDANHWVRGTATIEATRLTVSTNSATRAAWFADLVTREVPHAVLIDEERIPASDLARPDLLDTLTDGDDTTDDELASWSAAERADLEAQLDAMMTAHEDAWLDTQLPALDGVTPREAAGDPTRRDVLRRMLNGFDKAATRWQPPGRPMDAQRLARLLGMEPLTPDG